MATTETGPWFFALVAPTETTFTQIPHARVDMYVFSMDLEHKEGDNCTVTLEIENPGVGLLASGRLSWLWIAKRKVNTDIVPLFFGQLLSIPTDLLQTVIKVVFVARSMDQASMKLALAQTLKVIPYYDPIWVDVARQNDVEAVLEGYSARWHFDRVTLATSISDVLLGEGGTITFTEDDLYWDGVNLTIDNIPLSSISVRATVNWTQHLAGNSDLGSDNISTYNGDSFISDWPKAGSSIGRGWTVQTSKVLDVNNLQNVSPSTHGFSWKNGEKTHEDGDLLSVTESITFPGFTGIEFETEHSSVSSVGFPPMEMVTQNGATESVVEYPGSAASFSAKQTKIVIAKWLVSTSIIIGYLADIERKEVINFTLVVDVQDVLILPGRVKANPDHLDINGRDVGLALYVRAILQGTGNFSDGDEVLISSDTPYRLQTTLTSGEGHVHIGATLADSFTNLINAINVNGLGIPGVDYAIENQASGTVFASFVDSNSIMLVGLSLDEKIPIQVISTTVTVEATDSFTWSGGNPTNGQTVSVGGTTYTFDTVLQVIPQITLPQNIFTQAPYHVLIGANLEESMINFAAAIDSDGSAGTQYSTGTLQNKLVTAVVVNGVLTVYPRFADANVSPSGPFNTGTDVLVPDQNTVPMVDLSRSTFFPTDRGQQSIQALISRARAKARISTRAAKASFEADFEKCFDLSCRKNAVLRDPRFPGGEVSGKVISYFIKVSGDTGAETAGGEIGCAVGNGGSVFADPGSSGYADAGWVDVQYYEFSDQHILLASGDIWYSPPVDFPLPEEPLIVATKKIKNTSASQEQALQDAWALQHPNVNDRGIDFHGAGLFGGIADVFKASEAAKKAFIDSVKGQNMSYEITLSPTDQGPFSNRYELELSFLMIPKQIDLGAE